MVMSVF